MADHPPSQSPESYISAPPASKGRRRFLQMVAGVGTLALGSKIFSPQLLSSQGKEIPHPDPEAVRATLRAQFPQITYFVEAREKAEQAIQEREVFSRSEWLQENILTEEVIERLAKTRSRISIALNTEETPDPATQDLLHGLNVAQVPVDLWVNLSYKDGYWTHAGAVQQTREAVEAMVNDCERTNVTIDNIGLDLEMPRQVFDGDYGYAVPLWGMQEEAAEDLHRLAEDVLTKTHYGVHTYEIPVLSDGPMKRTLFAIPKAPEIAHPRYTRVAMVYSSMKPSLLSHYISDRDFIQKYSYGKGRVPALGIISANPMRPLDDEKLKRDIGYIVEVSPEEFFVFNLEDISVINRVQSAVQSLA